MIKGQVSQETHVGVSANLVWDVYRGLQVGKLIDELLPHVIGRVQVIEGDGGVGTILKVTFPPGTGGASSYMKEKFTKIDDEKRIKETEQIEGGMKSMGFHLFRFRIEIVDKNESISSSICNCNCNCNINCCIIRSTVEYEVDEEHVDKVSLVSPKHLEVVAQVIGQYLVDQTVKTFN